MQVSAVEKRLRSMRLGAGTKKFYMAAMIGLAHTSSTSACVGEYIGTGAGANNFFIDSADDPEVVLFDGADPKAARVCTRMKGYVQISYKFSDQKTGHFVAPPLTCADIFANRVAVRLDCSSPEHKCDKSTYACNDGSRHEAVSYIMTKYSSKPAEDADLKRRTNANLIPDDLPDGGVTVFVSEKPMDVDIIYATGATISYKSEY